MTPSWKLECVHVAAGTRPYALVHHHVIPWHDAPGPVCDSRTEAMLCQACLEVSRRTLREPPVRAMEPKDNAP